MKINILQNFVAKNIVCFSANNILSKSILNYIITDNFKSKKLLVILLLNCFSIVTAQSKPFSAYEKALDTMVKKYDTKHPNYKYLKTFINNFKNAKKTDSVNLTKIVTGIGFYLDYDNKDLDIYPAIFSHRNGKVDISGLRSSSTKKPSEEMKEYVNIYLNDWKKLGYNKTFKWLITHLPDAQSKLTEMTFEHKVNSYYDISFIRGDNDWMYAITYGDFGIGVYVFKLGLDDKELSNFK